METGNTLIGEEAYIHTIIDVVDQLIVVIDSENKKIFWEGQAPAVLSNSALQANKMRLYKKFETLALILGRIAHSNVIGDKELLKCAKERIFHMRRVVSINSILLQNYIDHRKRMISAIMASIETHDAMAEKLSPDAEQSLCR